MPDYDHSFFFTPRQNDIQNKIRAVQLKCIVNCSTLALEGSLKPSLPKVFAKFWKEALPYGDISHIPS